MYSLGLFSSAIKDAVGFSEINKSEAIETKVTTIQKSNSFVMGSFVKLNKIIAIVAIKYNYTLKI